MKLNGAEEVYTVHVWRQEPTVGPIRGRRTTVCVLHTGECVKAEDDDKAQCVHEKRAVNARGLATKPPLSGYAKCCYKDNFSRSVGRKIAFTRAIAALPKHERKLLWTQYFAQVKKTA